MASAVGAPFAVPGVPRPSALPEIAENPDNAEMR